MSIGAFRSVLSLADGARPQAIDSAVKDEPPAPPARPLRGRQAEAERNDRRVLEAAREVFARQGADAPVAAVAARAGVGMGSLYRRYGSKTELLQRLCVLAMEETVAAAEAALAVEDAWEGLAQYVRACVAFGSGALAPLAGRIETTPRMWEVGRRRQAAGRARGARPAAGRPAPGRHRPRRRLADRALRPAGGHSPRDGGGRRPPAPPGGRARRTPGRRGPAPSRPPAERPLLRVALGLLGAAAPFAFRRYRAELRIVGE